MLLSAGPLLFGCAVMDQKPAADNVVTARQLSLRGIDARQYGRWEQAELLFSQAIESCPIDERARFNYAETLWRRGAQREAISHMREAVRLSGGDAELLVRLGGMHLTRGEIELAGRQADRAITVNRELASAWALHGDVLAKRGSPDEALRSYHRALGIQDHYPKVQLAIAEIHRDHNRPRQALVMLQKMTEENPASDRANEYYFLQGLALKALARYDDAIDRFTLARHGGDNEQLLYHLAESHLLAGDRANANLAVAELLRRNPQHQASRQLKDQIDGRRSTAATGPAPR